MKKRRIFIAINFPQYVKKEIARIESKIANKDIRWVKPGNLHVTLVFVGYITDQELAELCRVTQETVKSHESFEIKLNKICLGPPGKPPRMIWLCGEKSEALSKLKEALEENLLQTASGFRHKETRSFSPHVTLSRLKQKVDLEEISCNLSFAVESVEVMESELKRIGAEYSIIETMDLA